MVGVAPTPGASTYCVTKQAVVGLTESVRWRKPRTERPQSSPRARWASAPAAAAEHAG
ncbi:MAG: hypothetical protein DLM58_06135 [Pseudonocardiales bacterium]|nr:MAG: hypothetical protein DLM58_06135 [Pseudonocardiales bacterium]